MNNFKSILPKTTLSQISNSKTGRSRFVIIFATDDGNSCEMMRGSNVNSRNHQLSFVGVVHHKVTE